MLEFTGNIHKVGEVQSFNSGFTKREVIIKEAKADDKWPNLVPFTLTKDRCSLADNLNEGDKVKVSFVLNGRAWDKGDGSELRYFCDNQVLKLEILETSSSGSAKPANAAQAPAPAEPTAADIPADGDDDIPF